MASSTRRSFKLGGESQAVTVEAAYCKRQRADSIPLHPGVAANLQRWLASRVDLDECTPVFAQKADSGKLRDTAFMMWEDLNRAGIPYQGDDGFYVDFHANRHTFISNLSRAGASPKVAQILARHNDIH